MSAINDLISQIEDSNLRARIQQEVDKMAKQKKFGLVFEEHLPETTRLYNVPVKRGNTVAVKADKENTLYRVLAIKDGIASCIAKVDAKEAIDFPVDDLVRVAEFGEPIYPYLEPVDSICNAPDSDLWHTLIEADNYHALQLLEYLYAGKVDCIYIDPPYNTGAKDWKYNNDYVDGTDAYKHSKWLSFMEKRLRLAKKLLNAESSFLIITIDEKEYLHLGCLLEDIFPEADIQMVTNYINPHGSSRKHLFSRADEYIFFVRCGNAAIYYGYEDMIHPSDTSKKREVWARLLRGGTTGYRSHAPNLFYPIYFNTETGAYCGVGAPLPPLEKKENVYIPDDCFAMLPVGSNGIDRTWGVSVDTFKEKIEKGYIKFGPYKAGSGYRALYHLQSGTIKAIEDGEMKTYGRNSEGTLIVGELNKKVSPFTMWVKNSHDARANGSMLLNKIFPEIRFSYPKSLYAVRDTLRFTVGNKPNALIIDFFAGSGTTLHAVNLLNAEDNGSRRCIIVTNNEVSEDEAKTLLRDGYLPGDEKWERLGIARYVTWPRTICSIKGVDTNGNSLKGNYIESDVLMSDGFETNANYFKLGFLDKTSTQLGREFHNLIPLLWMKAGAVGMCPTLSRSDERGYHLFNNNAFAILVNEDMFSVFKAELDNNPDIRTVFIITDSEAGYREMIANLNVDNTYQLYRDYIDNFRINMAR